MACLIQKLNTKQTTHVWIQIALNLQPLIQVWNYNGNEQRDLQSVSKIMATICLAVTWTKLGCFAICHSSDWPQDHCSCPYLPIFPPHPALLGPLGLLPASMGPISLGFLPPSHDLFHLLFSMITFPKEKQLMCHVAFLHRSHMMASWKQVPFWKMVQFSHSENCVRSQNGTHFRDGMKQAVYRKAGQWIDCCFFWKAISEDQPLEKKADLPFGLLIKGLCGAISK